MRKPDIKKSIPIEAFKHLLVYEPRRYYVSTWSHYIMQLMPFCKMTVVGDFDRFVKTVQNDRYEFSTIIINWDFATGLGDRGPERVQAIRAQARYKDTPICIFSDSPELSSRDRFQIAEIQNIIPAFGLTIPYGVLKAMRSVVDPESLKLQLADDTLRKGEELVKSQQYEEAIAVLTAATPSKRILIRKYLLLLQCFVATARYEKGRRLFETLLKLKVQSPNLFRLGSEIYAHLGNPAWSLKFAEIRYKAYPGNTVATLDYARGLLANGFRPEATQLLQSESMRSGTSKAAVYALLIEILAQDLNFIGLQQVLGRPDCTLGEASAIKLIKFALTLAMSGNTDGAVTLIKMMLAFCKIDGNRSIAFFHLGRMHYTTGKVPAAVSYFAQSLLSSPWADRVARSLHIACNKAEELGVKVDQGLVRRAVKARVDEVRLQLGQTLEPTLENASSPYGLKQREKGSAGKLREPATTKLQPSLQKKVKTA